MPKKKISKDTSIAEQANKKAFNDIISALGGFARPGATEKCKEMIPSGHWRLDFAITYGQLPDEVHMDQLGEEYDPNSPVGFPVGRIFEIYGPESSGKSSLAYRIVGYAQKMDFPC